MRIQDWIAEFDSSLHSFQNQGMTQYMEKLSESKRLKNRARIPAAFTPRIPDNAKMDPFLHVYLKILLLVPGSQPHSLPVFPDYAKMDPLLFT